MTINISIPEWAAIAICVMLAISAAVNVWHGIAVRDYLKRRN